MITLTLTNTNNQTVVFIRRPVCIQPKTVHLHLFRTDIGAKSLVVQPTIMPWSSLFGSRNAINVDIPLLSNIVFGTNNAVARVELGRKDQWKTLGRGEAREVSVSSAILRGVVVHKGLRYALSASRAIPLSLLITSRSGILTRFPLLTAVAASGVFFFLSFVILASCLLPAIEWRVQGSTEAIDPTARDRPVRIIKRESTVPLSRPAKVKRSRSLSTPTRQRPQVCAPTPVLCRLTCS